MGFLVVFNGQFTPLTQSITPTQRSGTRAIIPLDHSPEVSEFKDTLEEQLSEPSKKNPLASGIAAYQQVEKTFQEEKKRHYAKDIMTPSPKTVSFSDSVVEARSLIQAHQFRHIPVIKDQNTIVGMISERELSEASDDKKCHEVMMDKVIVCEESASVHEIAIVLLKEKLNALPIVNHKHELTGIITLSDILRYVIEGTGFLGRG